MKVYRLLSEGTIEDGIYGIAQEKLQLEQDLEANAGVAAGGEGDDGQEGKKAKKDLKKLLKIALDVEMSEKAIGDVDKVYTEL